MATSILPSVSETVFQEKKQMNLNSSLEPIIATVDLNSATHAELQGAIKNAGQTSGIISLTGLPAFPIDHIRNLLDTLRLNKSIQRRVNDAYARAGAEKLVWKDSFANGKGGQNVDQKRVLDLAAHRLKAISDDCPGVVKELGESLLKSLEFFGKVEESVVPKLMSALGAASQNPVITGEANSFLTAYRMVDYYARPLGSTPPRCGEHRDYGTLTIIFQDGVGGLEAKINGAWKPLPKSATILLFGWCTQIRSNNRIKAAMHRVVNPPLSAASKSSMPRRTAAVMFVAPDANASVAPVVLNGEKPNYIDLKRAGDLKPIMSRKWEMREGTIPENKRADELEEQRYFKTQDDIIHHVFGSKKKL